MDRSKRPYSIRGPQQSPPGEFIQVILGPASIKLDLFAAHARVHARVAHPPQREAIILNKPDKIDDISAAERCACEHCQQIILQLRSQFRHFAGEDLSEVYAAQRREAELC